MAQAKQGNTVKINYTGKLDDGTVFASSGEQEPLEFTLGQGQIIPGVEEAIDGMSPGESKTVKVPSEKAYGPYEENLKREIPKDQFPDDIEPYVGQRLRIEHADGAPAIVSVAAVSESSVTIDGNHALAGRDLTFELEVLEVS